MPLRHVTFASTNRNKFLEANAILGPLGLTVDFADVKLVELQSNSLEEIATEKARSAFSLVGKPVIVEDDGLFIDALNGFPGQYSSFVFQTIGNEGVLKLLAGSVERSATFRSLVAYFDGKTASVFDGKVEGRIAEELRKGGWGYDPIFIPKGSGVAFAELKEEKNKFSHRKKALEKFADWLLALN
jgi:XTP/dITP diphosphohydrolase